MTGDSEERNQLDTGLVYRLVGGDASETRSQAGEPSAQWSELTSSANPKGTYAT
jgi:hypothetical protein